jgi:coenzyme F420-0:L-glutamate ligase/coenzyme F420-1:gamma-L-glutamate ligase
LTRAESADWFRYGHVEAVRAALGVEPGTDAVPPPPVWPEPLSVRLARALAVAEAIAPEPALWSGLTITPDDEGSPTTLTITDTGAGLVAMGVFAQRLVTALWAEGVTSRLEIGSDVGSDRTVVRLCLS